MPLGSKAMLNLTPSYKNSLIFIGKKSYAPITVGVGKQSIAMA